MSSEYTPFAKRCKSRACGEPTKGTPLSTEAAFNCGYYCDPSCRTSPAFSAPRLTEQTSTLYFEGSLLRNGSLRLSSGEGDCAPVVYRYPRPHDVAVVKALRDKGRSRRRPLIMAASNLSFIASFCALRTCSAAAWLVARAAVKIAEGEFYLHVGPLLPCAL